MDLLALQATLRDAIKLVILEHWELSEYEVGERTITSQLFRYMSEHDAIPGHLRVDHEYNRHEGATKTIRSQMENVDLDPQGERRIYPDLILHRRGDDLENWLVVEAKRGSSCDDLDRIKVVALIEQYGYRWGVLLSLGMNDGGWDPLWEWMSSNGSEGALQVFSPDDIGQLNSLGKENWDRRRGL